MQKRDGYGQLEAISRACYVFQKQRGCQNDILFAFGASNGNRTRIASLGSWSFTIRLYPRYHARYLTTRTLYTIFSDLSIGIGKFFSEPFDTLRLFLRGRQFFCTFGGLRHILIMETGSPLQILSIRRFLRNNCLCNVFDNNNWIWIILIVLLFLCCGGCGC